MHTSVKDHPYRITQVDASWQVMRPHGSMPHAFADLDDAIEFVCKDSEDSAEIVELLVGQMYMVKRLNRVA